MKLVLIYAFLVLGACTKSSTSQAPASKSLSGAELITRGEKIFQLNCVSCHGGDPSKDGPVGPSLAGSSLELLEARVLRLEYPPDYKPKRTSGNMVALPYLKDDIPALHAYLNKPDGYTK